MTDEEALGEALKGALQEMLVDVEPSERLRDWVRTELRSAPAAPPKKKTWRSGRRLFAIFAPGAAAAAAALALVLGTSAAPSFAVIRLPGGLVRITLNDIEGVSGANAKLKQLGIHSIVVVPVRPGCKSHLQLLYIPIGRHSHGASISIAPAQIPAHQTDVLAAKQVSSSDLALGVTRIHGRAPSCVGPVKSSGGVPGSK